MKAEQSPEIVEYLFVDSSVVVGVTYDYRLADVNYDGVVEYHELTSLTVEQYVEIPDEFSLYQNYPNPFNPISRIRFGIPEQALVRITVYDILSRKVKTLMDKRLEPGYYQVMWNGKDNKGKNVSSGMYIYSI